MKLEVNATVNKGIETDEVFLVSETPYINVALRVPAGQMESGPYTLELTPKAEKKVAGK